MATASEPTTHIEMPKLPSASATVKDFIPYVSSNPTTPITQLLEPYKAFESELRKVYAQQPDHECVKDGNINLVPIFAGHEHEVKIRARALDDETDDEKSKYIMELTKEDRKPNGAPAVVPSFKSFKQNFDLFSESSLADLDWSNVVAAGSSVTTALLPVPEKWASNKRSLREYYHEHLAPASDVDLFIYGLNEEQGLEKIKQIERNIRDSILHETTTIRTKNAITIASQYPTRHVQIVLRLYDSISQIITGFDVDCACAAYTGDQVYAAPRAIASFMTQCNTIDLTRRSPSYENRLSKYSRRGFEVHWPMLDRTRIDPTIFERSFGRTQGLARLLILEKLPKSEDRDSYMDQRRAERGRPALHRGWRNQHKMGGNIKDQEEDDVAEWVEEEEVASYHTMTVPYGPKYHAAKINRLLYAKDLLLNAEWNQPDDNVRPVYLHRHPCFFGTAEEVLQDCCGFCPVPKTDEEIAIAEEDSRANISGELKFLKDDPGRQEIGSFHPITDDEWTTMAYVGDTARLCQAIVDGDLEHVEDWCSQEGVDVNRRDYTGRTPLHLACMTSTPEIVDCLVEHGARLIARLVDGRTALHIAAARGNAQMVKYLMAKSELNEEQEEEKEEARRAAKKATATKDSKDEEKDEEKDESDSEASEITLQSEDEDDSVTMGSFVKIDNEKQQNGNEGVPDDADDQDPDVYDIDVVAWDYGLTPLHLAILNGHLEIIELLVSEYGADVLLPVKLVQPGSSTPRGAIMSILLATYLPTERAKEVVKLLLDLGASSAQADMNRITVFHYLVNNKRQDIIDILLEADGPAAQNALKNVSPAPGWGNNVQTPLLTAIENGYQDMVSALLKLGASPTITFDDWIPAYLSKNEWAKNQSPEENMKRYQSTTIQPVILAACKEMGKTVEDLLTHGADPGSLEKTAYGILENPQNTTYQVGASLLDIIQKKLKTLREYKEPDQNFSRSDKPETLRGEGSYIYGLSEDTYRHWSALSDYQHAKRANKTAWDSYEKSQKKKNDDGVAEKKEAILKLIEELQQTEKILIEAGAKPFKEMHPELPEPLTYNNNYRYESPDPTPYETSFRFRVPDLNDIKKDGYIKLFEAAWSNDLETIKAMTLAPWAGLEHKPVNPPLKIAVQDANGFSPFSIAVLRGHRDLAKKIIEICAAQYHVDDGKTNRQRWTMRTTDDYDEDSESDNDDNLPIFSELVSDRFTFEDIGAVSNVVKSDVAPLTMLEWNCIPQRLHGRKPDHVDHGQYTLLEHAVEVDDMDLLKFIIEAGSELQALLAEEEDDQRCYIIDYYIFLTAIRLGRTTMLAEMIKETGVGLPLDDFVHKSGVEIKTKPRYYQGLSVSGKKRADWAQAPGNYDYARVVRENVPPLLEAAHLGNLDSVDWFMSSAPSRQYGEFAEKNKHDKRIKALEESGTGFDKTLRTWLGAKTELVLHCAILNSPDKDSIPKYLALIKHLVSVAPETLEQKSSEGWTPLHVAILAQRKEVVSYLISCGANQRSRDKLNRNVIHSLISGQQTNFDEKRSPERLLSLIELFDKQAVKEMMLERCSVAPGALTPLAYWMATNDACYKKSDIAAILCNHSSLEELEMINGEGDLPLHVAIKQGLSTLTSFFLNLKPTLLYRENTTGRTPLEMASDIYIASCVQDPPRISDSYSNFGNIQDRDSIVNKNARDFLPKQPAPEESKKRTWEICEGVDRDMSQNDRKRRLVSLFEANEVAKRVAGLKNSRSRQVVVNGGIVDGEVKRDVVSEWI